MRAFNFGIYGHARPAETAVCTAVPCILLTRKRSQVQTLSRPPHESAGQSVVDPELVSLTSWLGRAGAAPHPHRRARWPLPGPSTGPSGSTTTTERSCAPSEAASQPRCRNALGPALPCLAQPAASGDPHAGLASPGRAAVEQGRSLRPSTTRPGPRPPLPAGLPATSTAAPTSRPTRAVDRAARDTADHVQLDPFRS
jgi:hypothetical protein